MACSKYELGYEDERFEIVVSQRFHCPICFLVLKDPVMCKNQHYYCCSCIKKHLENSASCPTCLEKLSVDTLNEASRIVTDYISELNIRCDFYHRGCAEIVQVGHLKRHVEKCGFYPVQCSNDGCNVLVSVRDRLHHEAVCDFRKFTRQGVINMMAQMFARQEHIKEEMTKEIKSEMKAMKNEIKQETKGIKSGMKSIGSKDEMKRLNGEMKAMKNELKHETKGMIDEVKEKINLLKDEIVVGEAEAMGEIREEMRREIEGVKAEIKVEIQEEMNAMKEEIKNEIKEIVMNAMQVMIVQMKELQSTPSEEIITFSSK